MAPKVLTEETSTKVNIAEVVHHGEKIILPEMMSKPEAVVVIERAMVYESEIVAVNETIDTFPWDGAVALKKAMDKIFGVVFATFTRGMFGMKIPPQEIILETDAAGGRVSIPWGRFSFPGGHDKEWIQTDTDMVEGRVVMKIIAQVTRAHKPVIHKLAQLTREYLEKESLYRGKAFSMRFRTEDGDTLALPEPKFLDLSRTNPENLIFRDELMRALVTNVWTPLRYREATKRAGVPFKRGVLLAGPYGTGKTLAAHATAVEATRHGITFLYLRDVREIAEAIRFVKRYSPAVIFAEDVDRATHGERSVELDSILNTLDGIDSKNSEIMVVLTTNHLERINKAMLRPGRLDVILNVLPPDAKAARKLIKVYGGQQLHPSVNLTKVGEMLDGQIPAVVREAVERSKLEAISRTGEAFSKITDEDLEAAAYTVLQQQELFKEKPAERVTLEDNLKAVVISAAEQAQHILPTTQREVKRIAEVVGA